MQRHTMTEIEALERSVILQGERGECYIDFTRPQPFALSSVVVYTRHLFSPREGFLIH